MKREKMTRQNAGRVAQYEGRKFEDYIESIPLPPGVWLHRTPGRTKTVRGAYGRPVLIMDPDRKGLPDFHGGAFGKAAVFDAKRCETERWDVGGLTVEQRSHLSLVDAASSIAGVWLRFCEGEDVMADVWLSYREIVGVLNRGVKSLTVRDAMVAGSTIYEGRWWVAAGMGSDWPSENEA